MGRVARALAVICAAMLLAGCREVELYGGLSERDANEMLAVLKAANIEADKDSRDGKTWTLTASKAAFPSAVAVLEARGLPKERFESLGEVFKKQGLVSTPIEEHARLLYGLSQEVSNTLSTMDGVITARVHISIPEADGLADVRAPASAAVFIKYDPDVDLTAQVGAIKALVANAVEGVRYDRVTVMLSPARTIPAANAPRAPRAPLWADAAAALLAAGAAGWAWTWRRAARARSLA